MNKPDNKNRKKEWDLYPNISSTASMTECTGLMQTVPEDDHELLSYENLHSMQTPKKYCNKKNK